MKTCIVIPMKDPKRSKQRLSPVLTEQERQRLAIAMFRKTLEFFNKNFPSYTVLVVSSSHVIQDIAESYGAKFILEIGNIGLNKAVSLAAKWCCLNGYDAQLVIPADIPFIDVDEIRQLLIPDWPRSSVVICPAKDGGTNALRTSPPNVMPFSFGNRSGELHRDTALKLGLYCEIIYTKNISFDIDTPGDLDLIDQTNNCVVA